MALLLRYQHLVPRRASAIVAWQPPQAPHPSVLPTRDVLVSRGIIPSFNVEVRKEGWFERKFRQFKRGILHAFCMSGTCDEWDREVAFKSMVAREMVTQVAVPADNTVEGVVREFVSEQTAGGVAHVPRLVAQVVVALRMKLGMGAMDRTVPGNVALVRAETAKMLREWNLRHKDAAAHLLEIERCFFEDDTHYRVTTWRARACRRSKFLAWFLGKNPETKFDY